MIVRVFGMRLVRRQPLAHAVIEEANKLIVDMKDLRREIRDGNIEALIKLARRINRKTGRHGGNFIESVYEGGLEAYENGEPPAGERPITTKALRTAIGSLKKRNGSKKKNL